MIEKVFVIVNPASGTNEAVINPLYEVFSQGDIHWDIAITHGEGDGARLAQQALTSGVDAVLVYGGDGTIREAASVLKGGDVPLAILPGGTGNVLAARLGIPRGIKRAARLLLGEPTIKRVDVGLASGETFLVATGTGMIANAMQEADREMKRRMGFPAYLVTAFRELIDPQQVDYRIIIDGQEKVETEGVACLVSNGANLVIAPLPVPGGSDIQDGLLDVILAHTTELGTFFSLAADTIGLEVPDPLPRWQAQQVLIETDPPQLITCDGDITGWTPVDITIEPAALKVVVPPPRRGTGPLLGRPAGAEARQEKRQRQAAARRQMRPPVQR